MNVGDFVRYADPDPDCVELGVITAKSTDEGVDWIWITWWADGDINNEGHHADTDEIVPEPDPDPDAKAELKQLMRDHRHLYLVDNGENLPEDWHERP